MIDMLYCCDCKESILEVSKVAVCRDCFLQARKASIVKCDACGLNNKEDGAQVGSICLCLACYATLKEK